MHFRYLLPVVATFIVFPASAQQPELSGRYSNKECTFFSDVEKGKFHVWTSDGSVDAQCSIEHWPIRNPIAVMQCTDGKEPYFEIVPEGFKVSDMLMTRMPDEEDVCEDGPRG